MTEASTIRLADSDPLEETCLGVGVRRRASYEARAMESTSYLGGGGKAVIEVLLRRQLYAP